MRKTAAASNLEHLDICCFWAFAATPSPGTNVIRMQTNVKIRTGTNVKIRTGTNVKCKLGGIPKATNLPECHCQAYWWKGCYSVFSLVLHTKMALLYSLIIRSNQDIHRTKKMSFYVPLPWFIVLVPVVPHILKSFWW